VLEKDGFGWFVLLPKNAHTTFLGLLDKYVGFTAVESIVEAGGTTSAVNSIAEADGTAPVMEDIAATGGTPSAVESIEEAGNITTAVISESGTVGWLAEQEPQKVLVNGVDVTGQVERQDCLYKIALPESAVKTVVTVIW
jgi:hypothetical protein